MSQNPGLLVCRCSLIIAAVSLLAAASNRSLADPPPVELARFERTSVANNLIQPMEFDIAPDGTIFLIELAGKLKTIQPKSGEQQVVGELTVTTAQENGLIGLALSPDFKDSGWIYLQYSPPDYPGQRISRFQYRDGKLQLDSEQRLLEYEEQRRECCHHAGSLEFGPDGCLFIGTGDNTNPFEFSDGFAPIDQRPGREPWDAQRTAANSRNYNGKVLRIHPEPSGYTIPDGNLFPKNGSQGLPEIYVMGCRNPWRISVDQHNGYLYWGDVGPDAGSDGPRGPRGYDEVNQARRAGFFGWPYFIGNNYAYNNYDFESKSIGQPFDATHPLNQSRNNTGTRELPAAQPAFIYYPSANFETFPEVQSGGRTACAGPVYYEADYAQAPNRLPSYYERTLFAYEWSRSWIMAVHLDDKYQIQKMERFLPNEKITRPIQLKFDAGGSLYVLIYGETWGINSDAELVRFDYVRGNRTPKADLIADRTAGRAPLIVKLDGQSSTDRDNDKLTYRWSYNRSSGSVDVPPGPEVTFSSDPTPQLKLDQPGVYSVHLDVSDPSGASSRASINVINGNEPPQVHFVTPKAGSFFDPGKDLNYRIDIVDKEDGTTDYALLDKNPELDELDPAATSRAFVQMTPVGLDGNALGDDNAPPGLKLIRQSGCLNCHATHRPLVGPAFVEVANKYRDQPSQLEKSVERVQKGSTGVWGKVPMLPHSHRTLDEIQTMVRFVYSVKASDSTPMNTGLTNHFAIPADAQAVRLDATFSDAGFKDLPALTGSATLLLRARKIQAERATEFAGTQPLESGNAEGGKFMGAINHNGFLRFPQIPLSQVGGIRACVASAGAGGEIQLRTGSASGPLLAKLPVKVNGKWEEFYTVEAVIDSKQSVDIYAVFINEKDQGGLMNIDWIEFLPQKK